MPFLKLFALDADDLDGVFARLQKVVIKVKDLVWLADAEGLEAHGRFVAIQLDIFGKEWIGDGGCRRICATDRH